MRSNSRNTNRRGISQGQGGLGTEFTEAEARNYVMSFFRDHRRPRCPRCDGERVYILTDGRRRCRACRYTFHALTGRWISQIQIPFSQLMALIRGFCERRPISALARALDISPNTVGRAMRLIRFAIAAGAQDALLLFEGQGPFHPPIFRSLGRGRWECGPLSKIPVFGLREKDGVASISLIPSLSAEVLFGLKVLKVRKGDLVYTDRFHDLDCLLFCGLSRLKAEMASGFVRRKVFVDLKSSFWAYAKAYLVRAGRLGRPEAFPLLVKELEFRYNHRNQDLCSALVALLCARAPGTFEGLPRKGVPNRE